MVVSWWIVSVFALQKSWAPKHGPGIAAALRVGGRLSLLYHIHHTNLLYVRNDEGIIIT